MGISIVVNGSTVRFPDDSLGVLDPDAVEAALIEMFLLFGATQENAEAAAETAGSSVLAVLDGQQPNLVGPATENVAHILALLVAGFFLTQQNITDALTVEDDSLGIIDPDTARETLIAQLLVFGFPEESVEDVADAALPIFLDALVDDPTTLKKAVVNIANVLGIVTGGLTAQGQGLQGLEENFSTVSGLLQNEIQNRINADDQLRTEIEAEEAAREEADADLATRIDGHDDALATKADLVGGKLVTSQLPALATFERRVVANQAARLALTDVQAGDVAVQLDSGSLYMLAGDPSVLGDWMALESTSAVASVNGQTGTIVLGSSDVGADAAGSAAAAQAYSIQRSNHTGTQAQSTIVGLVGDLATLSASVTAAIATAAADATAKANAAAAASLPATYLDTDAALAANSDVKVPSQKALLTYFARSSPRHRWTSGVPTPNTEHVQASGSPVDQRVYWGQPYDVRRTRSFDRIGIQHVSGVPTAATIRFGFVNASDIDGMPTALHGGAEAGSSTTLLTTGGTGLMKLLTISTTLTPDAWFPVLVITFTGTQPVIWFSPNTFQWQVLPEAAGSGNILPFQNGVSGALPSTLTPSMGVNTSPVFFLRPT